MYSVIPAVKLDSPPATTGTLPAAFSTTLLAMASRSSLVSWNISLERQMEKIPATPDRMYHSVRTKERSRANQ